MKKVISTTVFLFCIVDIIYGQLPSDYPFKVILDDSGYVYMTGEENGDIFAAKYDISGNNLWQNVYIKPGYDRGMDIIMDEDKNIVVTGYITNHIDGLFDIILLKFLNLNSTQILLNKSFGNLYYNDQAFGIVCDYDNYFYITGYEIDKIKKQNMKLLKC